MSAIERFLIAMGIIVSIPYLIWRIGRTDHYAPLVVVQVIAGILLGPGVLGAVVPEYYEFVFTPDVVQALNGLAWWGVMVFVWIAGIELDLRAAWQHRRETGIAAGLALGVPLLLGCAAALFIAREGWMGPAARPWQFTLGIGMACSVTALPVLILLMERLEILRQPIGQRLLRYASADDIAIWGVLALILMDWTRIARQGGFLAAFAIAAWLIQQLMPRIPPRDRWYVGVIWLAVCAFGADWAGLHYMVGAFLAGAVMDSAWFDQREMDQLRRNVLLIVMPVYFLSTGLRTAWTVGGATVLLVAAGLLAVSVAGKLIGVHAAGRLLKWAPGEAPFIGWLLQTKGLIEIVFVNVLLDRNLITSAMFTAMLLLAAGSTMLTIPIVSPMLARMRMTVSRIA